MTLIILGRTKNALAEKSVAFGLIGSVVDGFGLEHLTVRVFQNLLGRGQTDGDLREVALYFVFSLKCHIAAE